MWIFLGLCTFNLANTQYKTEVNIFWPRENSGLIEVSPLPICLLLKVFQVQQKVDGKVIFLLFHSRHFYVALAYIVIFLGYFQA